MTDTTYPCTVTAWTRAYSPFRLGGDMHYLIQAELDCDEPVDAGRGILVQLAHGPDGQTAVVEPISGGLVGTTLVQVREDVAACDSVELMWRQIEEAGQERTKKGAEMVSTEDFWQRIGKGLKR